MMSFRRGNYTATACAQWQSERPPRRASAEAADAVFALVSAPEPEVTPPDDRPAGAPASMPPLLKRKRGRPRKAEAPRPPGDAPHDAGPQQPKRKRGRPRKQPLEAGAPGEGDSAEAACTAAASAGSAGLLPGSALPSLGLPEVPSLPMPSRLSGSGHLLTPLRRRAPACLRLCSCTLCEPQAKRVCLLAASEGWDWARSCGVTCPVGGRSPIMLGAGYRPVLASLVHCELMNVHEPVREVCTALNQRVNRGSKCTRTSMHCSPTHSRSSLLRH